MRALVARRHELEIDLREAIRRHEPFLVYQPIWSLDDRRVTGVEALLRWQHPTRGVVMPGEFVPTLEATGMIVQVGRDALFEACRQAGEWHRAGHPIAVSVNAAVQQLERDDFAEDVRQALERLGLAPEALTIEITESSLMRDPERTARRSARLRSLGIRLAIDAFGTGYSLLAYLQQLPVDVLKIDRAFVAGMDTRDGAALVHAIVQLGGALDLQILAEGIETPVQLERLRRENCRTGQGFLLAHPLDPSTMGELLERGHDGASWQLEATASS